MNKIFFTADQHFNHNNIIKYANRPFDNVNEMNRVLIKNHNSVVGKNDTTIHIGDFAFVKKFEEIRLFILPKMNGNHRFVRGNHDYWANNSTPYILEVKTDKRKIICCHFSMNVWNRSHYNEFHLFGHSHGNLTGVGKSFDVGVDCNNYTPVSYEQVVEKMKILPNNKGYHEII